MIRHSLDELVDHVRVPSDAPLILEYGECPYSLHAFRVIERGSYDTQTLLEVLAG